MLAAYLPGEVFTLNILRWPSCDGINYLSMRDYPGQGEALIGWYDAFFDAKPALGEVPPFSVLMSTTPCLAKFPKFLWTSNETFTARLLVRNELADAIPAGTRWRWSFGIHSGWAVAEKSILRANLRTWAAFPWSFPASPRRAVRN